MFCYVFTWIKEKLVRYNLSWAPVLYRTRSRVGTSQTSVARRIRRIHMFLGLPGSGSTSQR
jgi:hypothetical protein